MPGRTYTAGTSYRYGFNGKENDNEVKDTGNQIDFGERVNDPRIGRWLSLDPLAKKYPGVNPYTYVRNSPIWKYDPDGRTDYSSTVKSQKNKDGSITKTVTVEIVYAIINLSSKTISNSLQIVGDQDADETFSTSLYGTDQNGKNVTVNVITNIHYRLVDNINDVKEGENINFIVDDIRVNPGEKNVSNPVGLARHGGVVMAMEASYTSDRVLVRHEQGHNLGLEFDDNPTDPHHSKNSSSFMFSSSATGKNTRTGVTPAKVINKIFNYFLYRNDGFYKNDGSAKKKSEVKKDAQEFLSESNISYDKEKAKKAGVE
ncbi:hypothetical protein BH10BAC2_BH10BAC2_25200 [soil metagenome]